MIYVVVARETISSLVSEIGFTSTNIPATQPRTMYAIVQAIDGDARYCIDGSTPSTSLGLRLVEDQIVEVWGSEALGNFLAINDGATAKLEVIYMGTR